MNNHAVPTESEAIKHNIKDTHAVGFHLSPRREYRVLVKSHLASVCVCVLRLCICFALAQNLTCSSPRFHILLSVINPRPVTPVVITEPPRYIQVQQCVGVESHKEVMNKSALTSGSALENITLCAPTV